MLSSFVKFAALLLKFVITWFWLSWSTCIITCSPGRHNLTDQIAQVTVCVVKSETFYVRVHKVFVAGNLLGKADNTIQ